MATREQLIKEIISKAGDSSYANEYLADLLNDGLRDVAAFSDPINGFEIFLSKLETSAVLTTSTSLNYVDLPANYHKNLYRVDSAAENNDILIFPNFKALKGYFDLSEWGDSGQVEAVTVAAGKLYYNKIPSTADSLTIHYYKQITLLTKETDIPFELPEHLHRELLVNYVCKELYSEIEDGVEGEAVNTKKYSSLYGQAIAKLYHWIGDEKSIKQPYRHRQVKTF